MPTALKVLLNISGGWFFKIHSRWRALILITLIVGMAVTSLSIKHYDLNGPGFDLERGTDDILGLQLGLDLSGGIHLVYQAGEPDQSPSDSQMEGLLDNIRLRVAGLGTSEPNIQQLGDDRILIQMPGLEDVERAKRLIGETASLRIIERICLDQLCTTFEDQDTGLTGGDLRDSAADRDSVTSLPLVRFNLRSSAARSFAELTQRIFNTNNTDSPDQLAFFLDDREVVSAGVRQSILAGSGQITMSTAQEARDLAIQLESGRLPIPITVLTEKVVDASLGSGSLEDSLIAGLLGLALVFFFMVAYYRMSGLLGALALVFYTAIVLAVFKVLPVTLTLAGVAAFILSMGMAVDANILIFERIKEELRIGQTLNSAIQIGFQRAWSSIRDGNISTLIIAGVLYWFGSQFAASAVTGFAVTLIIGVLTSMFTAVFLTKNLLIILSSTGLYRFPRLFTPESLPKRAPGNRPTPHTQERGA